ncbi:quinone-dependent dihydroorotate dehydrogenase [Filimonas effusa]|uniref:Dihydroorotate dehydrogenase (quinone) n=1 Tax=Filimonas effusa TaxID=2508721 RepID=A0A4Q1D2J3_9BACT|nr:quinone-dependent dihydroorotate dehydrogenase [Filimonas effusa]
MYPLLRQMLFKLSPEKAHHVSMSMLHTACSIGPVRSAMRQMLTVTDKRLEKEVFGLRFRNPVGLGAGFDKNASYLKELETLGFGFVEIGTITPKAQPGNEQPRLFRLPADKALINRMGFNNDGVEAIAQKLEKRLSSKAGSSSMIIGGNIGKNKVTANEEAWRDYEICFRRLFDVVDYFVVNVSSPNTPGLRELQEKEALRKILSQLQEINQGKNNPKPLLLKIAPDLTEGQLADIASLATEIPLSGLVATNTTISREGLTAPSQQKSAAAGAGGLSGKPLTARATEIVSYLHRSIGSNIPIIASGGIFTGNDAKEKLDAGAELVQVWTGFIYEGPFITSNICKHLLHNNVK